jgi:hypothetical protein
VFRAKRFVLTGSPAHLVSEVGDECILAVRAAAAQYPRLDLMTERGALKMPSLIPYIQPGKKKVRGALFSFLSVSSVCKCDPVQTISPSFQTSPRAV